MSDIPCTSATFVYPTRTVGGAQYLFARTAEYLIRHTSLRVTLVDYLDGFIRNKLRNLDCRFVEFKEGHSVIIDQPTILVLPLSFLSFINNFIILSESTKLFFWDLHPYNLVEQMALSGIYKKLSARDGARLSSLVEPMRRRKLAKFVQIGGAKYGIGFMAKKNITYNQALLGFDVERSYLPLAIDTAVHTNTGAQPRLRRVEGTLHMGWLGRLDAWKSKVVVRLLRDAEAYQKEHGLDCLRIHIIGDGTERNRIQSRCPRLKSVMTGNLQGAELTDYVFNNLDVGFAMGTSALEFAIRGIPTVLTSSGLFQDDLLAEKAYRWIPDTEGYDLSAEETSGSPALRSFSSIVHQMGLSSEITDLGLKCQQYAIEHHALPRVAELFAKILIRNSFTYQEMIKTGVTEFSFYERCLFALKKAYKARG